MGNATAAALLPTIRWRISAAWSADGSVACVVWRRAVVDAVRPRGTNRPWSPFAGDVETEIEPASGRAVARPVDATPAESELQGED